MLSQLLSCPGINTVVVRSRGKNVVRAFSTETSQKVWDVKKKLLGKVCDPEGMVYSPEHKALLLVDGINHRLLVLRKGTNDLVFTFPKDTWIPHDLVISNNQLVIEFGTHHLSFYSLQPKPSGLAKFFTVVLSTLLGVVIILICGCLIECVKNFDWISWLLLVNVILCQVAACAKFSQWK